MNSPNVSSEERAGKYCDRTVCVSPAFPRQRGLPSVRTHSFLKAKFVLCGLVVFFFLNVPCDRIFPYLALRVFYPTIQPSKLRRNGHCLLFSRTLSLATLIIRLLVKERKEDSTGNDVLWALACSFSCSQCFAAGG